MKQYYTFILFVLFFFGISQEGYSHQYSLTHCRAFVSDQYLIAELSVPIEDLIFFQYLGVDSSRAYTLEEIDKAGSAYTSELRRTFSLNSDVGDISMEHLHYQSLKSRIDSDQTDTSTTIRLTAISKFKLKYSFKYAINKDVNMFWVGQNFGVDYPLIPALMVLDVNGSKLQRNTYNINKGVPQKILLTENAYHQPSKIIVSSSDSSTSIEVLLSKTCAATFIGTADSTMANLDLLSTLLELKIDGQLIDFATTPIEIDVESHLVKYVLVLDSTPSRVFNVRWAKFNRSVRKIPVEVHHRDEKKSYLLSRFNDTATWQ